MPYSRFAWGYFGGDFGGTANLACWLSSVAIVAPDSSTTINISYNGGTKQPLQTKQLPLKVPVMVTEAAAIDGAVRTYRGGPSDDLPDHHCSY